jgi:uncharacterized damage-inducible protein DinB
MKKDELEGLVQFNAWANGKVLGEVDALSAEQFTRDLRSSFSSVRDTLAHIMGVEWVWLERLRGRSPAAIPAAKEFADIASLRVRWAETEESFRKYLQEVTQAELDGLVEYKTLSFGMGKNARWQMIQHVVNHGTYHRGQVIAMLRQLGANGVGTDLITFYREKTAGA